MHFAAFVSSFGPGGAEYVTVMIANGLAEIGHRVDLLTCDDDGPLQEKISSSIRIVNIEPTNQLRARMKCLQADRSAWMEMLRPYVFALKASPTLCFMPGLADYLKKEKPDGLLSAAPHLNVEAVLAKRLSATDTRHIVSEHINFTNNEPDSKAWRRRHILPLMRRTYTQADFIVAVSKGVAEDLSSNLGIPLSRINIIANPVISKDFHQRAMAPVAHPWFEDKSVPVLLSVGRLSRQKDFPTLLRAFAKVRASRPARLVVIGAAIKLRKTQEKQLELSQLATKIGVADDVAFLGYQPNPIAYMARASLFVLSSLYEGLPTVLIEALAAGCPVVSTNCPSGPAEILNNGEFGHLVPVGDSDALARAICDALDRPTDRETLIKRAEAYNFDTAIRAYEELLTTRPGSRLSSDAEHRDSGHPHLGDATAAFSR